MDTRLCIVGIFFDGYYDIWEDFLELFNRNWPDCPYPVYIVDGTKNLDFQRNIRLPYCMQAKIRNIARKYRQR